MSVTSKKSNLQTFLYVVFGSLDGYVAFRSFPENGNQSNRPILEWVKADEKLIANAARFSKKANNNKFGFYIIPGTVGAIGEAKKHHIQEMQSILVDIDDGNTEEKLQKLTKYIGKPTLVVESGGITKDGHTKLHVYWQLVEKVTGENLQQIADLRRDLALAIDGDIHFKSLSQPIRVAGSIYHKNKDDKLVRIRSYHPEEYELGTLATNINTLLKSRESDPDFQKILNNANKKPIEYILTEKVYEGDRYNRIGQVVGYWIRRYYDGHVTKEQALSEIFDFNQVMVDPPWSEKELAKCINGLWRTHIENHGHPDNKQPNNHQSNIRQDNVVSQPANNTPKPQTTQTIVTNEVSKQDIPNQVPLQHIKDKDLDLTDNKNYDLYDKMQNIIANPKIIIDKLDISKPTYSKADIEKTIFKFLGIDTKNIESALEQNNLKTTELNKLYKVVISSPKMVAVNLYDLKGNMIFPKKDRIELEQRLIKDATSLAKLHTHNVNITTKDLQITDTKTNITLSKEQQNAITQLGNSSNLVVLKGRPGSGKTTVLRDFVRAVKENGYNVIATAPTNKGAMELENSIGTKVINTAKLRKKWELAKGFEFTLEMSLNYYKEKQYKSKVPVIDNKTILIIDEASMIDMREMYYFISNALRAGAKVIVVGDTNQHKAIKVAGSLIIEKIAKVIELTEIHRHNNPDSKIREAHISATEKLSQFKLKEAFDIYEKLGALNIHDTEFKAKQAIIHEYVDQLLNKASLNGDIAGLRSVAIGCYTNENVDYFNTQIREHLKNCGILKGRDHLFQSGSGSEQKMMKIALGEQIVFSSNKIETENSGSVNNREIGIVSKILESNQKGIERFQAVIRRNGADKIVDIKTGGEDYPVSFNYGYALTSHVFEGAKIEKMLMYFEQYYESLMVLATRHVNSLKIYAAEKKLENIIYSKKDLDIDKARENYQIVSYAKDSNMEDGEVRDPYPASNIGLMLDSSKRADLTTALSQNYGYQPPKKEQQYLQDLKGEVGIAINKMQESQHNLRKWQNIHSEKIIKSIASEFKLKSSKDINIRPVNLDRTSKLLTSKLLKEQPNLKESNQQNINLAINNYIQQLKGGNDNEKAVSRPEWQKLTKFDQDVVIYSYLNDNAKNRLSNLVNIYHLCQKRIITKSNSVVRYKVHLQKLAIRNTKFSGNHLVVSNYLKGLKDLANATDQLNSWQQKYLAASEQAKIKEFLTKKLNINTKNLGNLQINPYTLIYASGDFQKDHVQQHKEELENLKEQKEALSKRSNKTELPEYKANQKRLDEIFLNNGKSLDTEIRNYLNNLAINNKNNKEMVDWKDISPRDQHLIIGKILPNNAISELTVIIDTRQKIKQENISNAKLICDNYKGFINPELKNMLQEKKYRLEQGFLSISQKWQKNMALKFDSKANKDIRNLTEKDLKQAMGIYHEIKKWQKDNPKEKNLSNMPASVFGSDKVVISKYQRIVMSKFNSKDPLNSSRNIMNRQLCPITKNAIKSYREFDRNKHGLQKEIKEIQKGLANEKLGITNDPLKLTMQEVLASQNLNYETVLASADKVDYRFYFQDISVKSSFIENRKASKEVVELLETLSAHKNKSKNEITKQDLVAVSSKVTSVIESLESHEESLTDNRCEIKEFEAEYDKDMGTINDLERYQTKEFPEFLSRIFKEDSHKIIEKFNDQVVGLSKEETEKHICSDDFLKNLGQLKSGVSSQSLARKIFTKINERESVKQNVNNARMRFAKYFNSKKDIAKLKNHWQQQNYTESLKNQTDDLQQLQKLLPNKQEQVLLNQLLEVSKAKSNNQDNIGKYQQILVSSNTTKILNDYANIKNKLLQNQNANIVDVKNPALKSEELKGFNLASKVTNVRGNEIKNLGQELGKKIIQPDKFQEDKAAQNSANSELSADDSIANKSSELKISKEQQHLQQTQNNRDSR
ncbi:MAG: AAA family ATPase [Rickettsiaceae bacterium]|nr:AAA family ATPase [Rickettsiaceae bacterium]